MSQFGFVYILSNEYMPDLIKIGCTERSPQQRAEELSKHTGVPAPFRVLCFAEFDGFQQVEHRMHEWCKDHRVNTGREFFKDCLTWAVQLLWFNPGRLSFTDATLNSDGESELIPLVCEEHQHSLDYLRNPWAEKVAEDAKQERHIRYHIGDLRSDSEIADELKFHESVDVVEEQSQVGPAQADVGADEVAGAFVAPDPLPWERTAIQPAAEGESSALRIVGGTAA